MEHTKDRPNQYQIYGLDANGQVTHAGVHGMARMNAKEANKAQRKWLVWQAEYLRNNPGDYPLRHTKPTTKLHVCPVNKRGEAKTFNVLAA